MSNNNSNETASNFNWEAVSEAMGNDKTVLIVDNDRTRYKGKILRSDHRSTFVAIHEDEKRLIFNRNIVEFEIIEE